MAARKNELGLAPATRLINIVRTSGITMNDDNFIERNLTVNKYGLLVSHGNHRFMSVTKRETQKTIAYKTASCSTSHNEMLSKSKKMTF